MIQIKEWCQNDLGNLQPIDTGAKICLISLRRVTAHLNAIFYCFLFQMHRYNLLFGTDVYHFQLIFIKILGKVQYKKSHF